MVHWIGAEMGGICGVNVTADMSLLKLTGNNEFLKIASLKLRQTYITLPILTLGGWSLEFVQNFDKHHIFVCVCACMCDCVCEREREKERKFHEKWDSWEINHPVEFILNLSVCVVQVTGVSTGLK